MCASNTKKTGEGCKIFRKKKEEDSGGLPVLASAAAGCRDPKLRFHSAHVHRDYS